MPNIQHKRGTRAALDALAASNGLVPWQVYAISDEGRLALALTASTYQTFLKAGEGGGGGVGYYVGPTAPDPATYPLWLNTTAGVFLVWTGSEWMEPGVNYVPPGGSTGQVLLKLSGDDFDVAWGSPTAPSVAWGDITGKPTTFAPSAHTHAIADVTGLETALGGKEPAITKSAGYAKWSGSAWTFVDEAYLTSAAIGSSVQAYSANLTSWASLETSAKQDAITISATAPASPTLNQLWFDIS